MCEKKGPSVREQIWADRAARSERVLQRKRVRRRATSLKIGAVGLLFSWRPNTLIRPATGNTVRRTVVAQVGPSPPIFNCCWCPELRALMISFVSEVLICYGAEISVLIGWVIGCFFNDKNVILNELGRSQDRI